MKFSCCILESLAVIRVEGKHDDDGSQFSALLQEEVTALLDAGHQCFLIGLELDYVNSRSLGAIVSEWQRVKAKGGELAVYSTQRKIHALLRIVPCRLPIMFFVTEEDALRHLLGGAHATVPWPSHSDTSHAPGIWGLMRKMFRR
jgi:anti-anti-sigma factor